MKAIDASVKSSASSTGLATASISSLDESFRAGSLPEPSLEGFYHGRFLAFDIAPGLTWLASTLASVWMPWVGKGFNAREQRGINYITKRSRPAMRLLFPFHRVYSTGRRDTYRAFPFRATASAGLFDPDRRVLKIDYDVPGNPRLLARQLQDEIVHVQDGFYLGKAHFRWWWGRWQTVAYFGLWAEPD
jgi:hypothetical protein